MVEKKDAKIVVLGAKGVGKTAIVVRFLTRRFLPEYASGIESIYHHKTCVGGKDMGIEITDVSGQDATLSNAPDAYILVYSVTSKRSFQYVKDLFTSIKEWNSDYRPKFVIVANKIDLAHKRKVDRIDGIRFAKLTGSSYFEVAASRDIEAITDIFQRLCLSYLSTQDKRKHAAADKRKGGSSPTEGRKRLLGSIQEIFRKRPSL